MARSPGAGKRPRKRFRRRRSAGSSAMGPDSFTHLNDDLLRTIVSRLPVRSAFSLAGTSRHFWAQVPALVDRLDSLTLYEPHFPTPLPDSRPLLLRRLAIAPHPAIPPSKFGPILKTAAGHGITELSIGLTRRARLPRNVFLIRSLAVLTLDTCAVPRWSPVKCPCLRTLKLHRISIHQKTINQILASASCLATLDMTYCTGNDSVESSSLRHLVFKPTLKQAEVTIRAEKLETITLYTRAKASRLELAPAPEIRKAYLHISVPRKPMKVFKVRSFLGAAKKLNCLTLRGQAMKLLSSEYKDTPNLEVVFEDMRILSVSLNLSRERELVFLLKLLEKCPNLQQLTLSDVNTDDNKEAETEDKAAETDEDMAAETDEDMAAETDEDMAAKTDEDMATETDEDNSVPYFSNHKERLTKIPCLTTMVEFKFRGFKPEEHYEKSLVTFILNRAKNLKKVGVQFAKSQEAAVKKILSVRKAPAQRTIHKFGSLYVELDYQVKN